MTNELSPSALARRRERRAYAAIELAGLGVKRDNPRLTIEQASDQAMREDPDLYTEYMTAKRRRMALGV